jgi:hypothetical protein
VFELGLAGGFQLIDSHETDVASYYDDRREVDTFTTNDECILKITASLRDAGRRIAMAKAAQERTRTHHLYHHRVDTILAAVSKVTATKQTKPVINKRHRPRLLFVTHNVLAQGNFGGVEVYQETVIREVMNRYDIFFYKPVIPSSRPGSREYCLTNSRGDVLAQYFTSDFDPVLTMTQPEAEQVFSKALSDYRFDMVHFQHLLGHVSADGLHGT